MLAWGSRTLGAPHWALFIGLQGWVEGFEIT